MALDFLLDSILWKTNISWCHAPVSLANISWYFKNILWRKNNCFFENDQKIMYCSVLFGIFFKQPALDWLYLQYIHLVFILHYFKYSFCPMIFSINFPWWSLPIKNCSHFKLKYLLIGMSYHYSSSNDQNLNVLTVSVCHTKYSTCSETSLWQMLYLMLKV